MPIAVHFIEVSYILMIVTFLFVYNKKGLPFIEGIFLLLIICSPYSISIIPFRQDTYEFYGLYNNTNILNLVNLYKLGGLSILDIFAMLVILKNLNTALYMPRFFRFFYL